MFFPSNLECQFSLCQELQITFMRSSSASRKHSGLQRSCHSHWRAPSLSFPSFFSTQCCCLDFSVPLCLLFHHYLLLDFLSEFLLRYSIYELSSWITSRFCPFFPLQKQSLSHWSNLNYTNTLFAMPKKEKRSKPRPTFFSICKVLSLSTSSWCKPDSY